MLMRKIVIGVLLASACPPSRAQLTGKLGVTESPRLTTPVSFVPPTAFSLSLSGPVTFPVLKNLAAYNPAAYIAPLPASFQAAHILNAASTPDIAQPVQNITLKAAHGVPSSLPTFSIPEDSDPRTTQLALDKLFGEDAPRHALLSLLTTLPADEASAAGTGQGGKTMDSSLRLPQGVTPERAIKIMSLILPDEARLELEGDDVILLSFYGRRSRNKLFTYEIKRDRKSDFSGPSLPALIKDLAGATAARYRGLENDDRSLFKKMNQIMDVTGGTVIARHAKDRNYSVFVRKVHTTEQNDWY